MYNPYEEFEKSNTPIDEEVKQRIQSDLARSAEIEDSMMAQEAQQQKPAKPGVQAQQPGQPQQPTQQQQPQGFDLGQRVQSTIEGSFAVPIGLADFGVDLVNKIPGVNLPKIPKFKSELIQSARELTSIVAPTIMLTKAGVKAGNAANARVGWAAGKSELMKWVGEAGVSAGAGAVVDSVSKLNETDDNLQGSLKKAFPKTFNWISDDWATLDTDSPDIKRAKNVNEGVGLGIFSDFLLGAAKLAKAIRGTKELTRWIPEDESAKKFFSNIKSGTPLSDDVAENAILTSAARREKALDDIGDYQLAKNPDLDQPLLGVHDVFDVEESGVRSADDMGVVGAAVDAARISKNAGTVYGRLGSIVTEAALKFGLDADQLPKRTIVKEIVDQIKKSGKYSYRLDDGRIMSNADIDKAGEDLAQILIDPRMEPGMLKATLDNFKNTVDGIENLNDVGYRGAVKAMKSYLNEFINMDTIKAQAYLTTSLAGQVSDIAEGARLMEGTAAVERAQEMILDRMEYLMVEKGLASYIRGRGLANIGWWNRMRYAKNPERLKELAEQAMEQTQGALANIIPRAKATADSLRNISKERPEFLKPLEMAWEFTDGNIDSISKLNNFVEQSLANVEKAFMDGQPEIPNVIVQGMWSNIYNSVLTSISTPLKAGFGNAVLLLEKPISVLGGALLSGDLKTIRRGWYQYSAFGETLQKGLSHMSTVYRKAASDPSSVNYIIRDDIAAKNEQTLDILYSFALAAEQRGNSGPMALYQKAEALNDLANNPFLRFGANAMTALDGFARAVIANAEARGRVWDKYISKGDPIDGKTLKLVNDEIYNEMFDSTGMITDKAVDYASREIAMNLDNPMADALGSMITRFPAMKPFLMFPKTSANMIAMTNKHSPISLFANDYNKIAYKPLSAFSREEVIEILTSKGLPVDENIEQTFNTLRAEIRGRKAIGTLTIMSAFYMFSNDRLRGNGHFDKERQQNRQQLGWKPRTYQGWDGKWYSYDGLGPISDFLAMTADVMDNFDSVTGDDLATNLNKMGFLLSANLTNKSMLAGLEPMNDVLSGNPAALNRWAASFASSLLPLSSARNELGRVIAPQLRELDMEFTQLLRNRNKYLDAIDPKGALPDAHDWMDGQKIGYPENFFVRMFNAVSPMKVYDGISKERQFLIDVEYDVRPSFMKNQKGVEYTPAERSELFSIMGKQGYFKSEVQRIMQSYDAKQWRQTIRDARNQGAKVEPDNWDNLYNQLNAALFRAKGLAEAQLSNRDEIYARQYQGQLNRAYQERGVASGTDPVTGILNIYR